MTNPPPTSLEQFHHHDRWWDANLRQWGPHLVLPSDPEPEQRERWRRIHIRQGLLRSYRLVRLGLGGGAVAAMVLIGVTVWSVLYRPVSAGTIFSELKQSLNQPLKLVIHNFNLSSAPSTTNPRATQWVVNGWIYVGRAEQRQLYADLMMDVKGLTSGLADQHRWEGCLEVRIGLSPEQEWIYLRLHDLRDTSGAIWSADNWLYRTARMGVYLTWNSSEKSPSKALWSSLDEPLSALSDRQALIRLVDLIERHAQGIRTIRDDSGGYELHAHGVYAGLVSWADPNIDRAVFENWREASLKVTYRPRSGIGVVEITSPQKGILTWDWRQEGGFDPQELNLSYQRQQRPAMVFDLTR